ncbi:MAG: succinate dehydrogenase/fumarate reductase iron-sulfur subunit [Candidatus Hydrogenedentes bacterium]|nr:succinate dehydrogenase/fumarate reductase iron-sulfur subunit [Candidatus Hydrogenedentota bacterium]MBI3118704.1 succinate dehydrogenase/fumarate reductase iron-sulfur subunit [Candidatus Hydrogenedentota bacterium]
MAEKTINVTLKVWRQPARGAQGRFETYQAKRIPTDASFLEMLDIVNNGLERNNQDPIAFDHDCREGICGSCGAVVNGRPHGPRRATTLCQLHMREFKDGDTIVIEPWRANGFPVIKDLIVDRAAFDRIIQTGGFISVRTGQAPEAHSTPVPLKNAEEAMDAAECIGCGACVAACPNASASLFTAAKIAQLCKLPQGHPERTRRVLHMVRTMDKEGFGSCSKQYECEAACPKEIKVSNITVMNREYLRALLKADA